MTKQQLETFRYHDPDGSKFLKYLESLRTLEDRYNAIELVTRSDSREFHIEYYAFLRGITDNQAV